MKTKLLSLGIMMFCLMGMQSVMLAQTVYVNSSTGNDTSGDGSSGNPYKTFSQGYAMTSAGGTLDLTGTFTWTDADETGDVADNGSSTQVTNGYPISKSITVNGHGVGSTIIQAASSSSSSSRLFYIAPTTNITVTFQNLEIRYGKTTYLGGCFFLSPTSTSTINILNCHIHDNVATQGGCGIELAGYTDLNITNSTLSANSGTNASGGGIRVQATGTLKITNSTICNNTVTKGSGNGLGGGIYFMVSTTTSYITNCTIAGNSASEAYGGGLCQDNGTVYLKNNLIANNSSGLSTVKDYEFYAGTLTDNGYNIIEYGFKTGSGTGAFSGTNITGDQTNLFGTGISASPSLALNSSLNGTPTLALSAGSVAIGAGSTGTNGSVTVPSTDQRGLTRTTTYDIGAYEYGASSTPVPTITGISPTSGPTAGGTSVVITGTNLTGATAVNFGGTAATGYTVNSATQITATSPAKTAGTVDVTVTTAGGTSATGSADQFTYIAAPTISSISPTSGPTAGSTTVTVTGTNLTGATAVNFGGTAGSITANTATSITATSPAKTAGTVDVTVTTAGGTSATSTSDQFTYAIAPTVTTQNASVVTSISATGNGNITDLGTPNPTAYGVCWNTSGTPTTSDSKVDLGTASATGAFTASITGLTANTTYHVRAFATNTANTSYGSEVTFTTSLYTGLDNTTATALLLYPNPTLDGFYIQAGESPTLLSISDLSGRIVLVQQVTGNSYINISSLQKGAYVVKVNGLVAKLVKK